MLFAPRLDSRRGRLYRVLTGLGLGTTAGFLTLVALVLFLTTQFVTTPEGLYHRTWQKTAEHIFDPTAMGNWASWEHKFDGQIHSDEDAIKHGNEALKSLHDRYTYLMSPKDVAAEKERGAGNFTGVGMVFDIKVGADGKPVENGKGSPLPATDADGYPVINKVMKGAPAESSGLHAGDAITSVDGHSTKDCSLDELVKMVRGEAGTSVTFGIRSHGQDKTLTVTRQTVAVPDVITKMLPGDIGYLRLENFEQLGATRQVMEGLKSLKDARAIIFDLRGNPGGYVTNAIGISSLFIEQGTVVVIKSRIPGDPASPQYETGTIRVTADRLIQESSSTVRPGRRQTDASERTPYMINHRPVVILVDGNSASAAEMTTGAIKDNGAATVIGARTFGKGIGQSSVPMPNGTQLHVTSLRYYTPNGTWLGDGGNSVQQGIVPDIAVEPLKKIFEYGSNDDNQLGAAVEFLQKKLAGK